MNVYDRQRMADALAADGYAATDAIDDADLVLLNTCHIREKAAEKVYSELGRIRELKAERASARARDADRRRRLRRAGRGRRRSSAARRRSTWSSARRPITACPTLLRTGARRRQDRRDRLRRRGQVRAPAGADARRDHEPRRHRLPHRAGRLRQVLHLLRRALYARLGSVAAGGADRRRGASGWSRPACAR